MLVEILSYMEPVLLSAASDSGCWTVANQRQHVLSLDSER